MIRIPIQSHQATTRWLRSISYMCIKEIWVWARSTRHKIKRQKSIFCSWNCSGRPDFGGGRKREFFLLKNSNSTCVFHQKNSSTLDPIKGEIFKIQNDKCHTLSLWTWHMSNTWTLNLTSVLHMSKFAHLFLLRREIQILNFLPSFLTKSAHWP